MSHPVVHFEFWSRNPEAASRFYSSVFDWRIDYAPQLSYWLIDTGAVLGGGGVNGGMFQPQAGSLPAKLALYVGVDDVGAYVDKAVAAGARVLVPETEIPGVGWSAVVLDPDQRAIGLFKPLPQPATTPPAAAERKRPAPKARGKTAAKKPPAKRTSPATSRKSAAKKKRGGGASRKGKAVASRSATASRKRPSGKK